jgi:hypothetical protein
LLRKADCADQTVRPKKKAALLRRSFEGDELFRVKVSDQDDEQGPPQLAASFVSNAMWPLDGVIGRQLVDS